jgi:hypothetical protein
MASRARPDPTRLAGGGRKGQDGHAAMPYARRPGCHGRGTIVQRRARLELLRAAHQQSVMRLAPWSDLASLAERC